MVWYYELNEAKKLAKEDGEYDEYYEQLKKEKEEFRRKWKELMKKYNKKVAICKRLVAEGQEPLCHWNTGKCPFEYICELWAED